ncbi:MAG: nucleoside-diphosphate kinase, partial [Lentisphaeria bacterium]|nr:nucleoside-diphosphate kinase [Lentisphaeria bacterium]NQZ69661.1 nucleoside-diphosphate kinase [Lentisphaeria bacterium]
MYEKSLIIFKPDAVQRQLTGRILQRFEDAGIKIHALNLQNADRAQAESHYDEHKDKPFFSMVVDYICSGPVLVVVFGGLGCISKIRSMVGATEPAEALPGTIRGDFAHQVMIKGGDDPLYNLIHASAHAEDAEREIKIWFA